MGESLHSFEVLLQIIPVWLGDQNVSHQFIPVHGGNKKETSKGGDPER